PSVYDFEPPFLATHRGFEFGRFIEPKFTEPSAVTHCQEVLQSRERADRQCEGASVWCDDDSVRRIRLQCHLRYAERMIFVVASIILCGTGAFGYSPGDPVRGRKGALGVDGASRTVFQQSCGK